ncbi:unnamed protein product, partial [Rotaria sp. Silwood1]
MIHNFYRNNPYEPTVFTCYTHLKCNRGPHPSCLDWSEICDGKVDCLDGGLDEQNCWQLEINNCGPNEYRCVNGQCIPLAFLSDDAVTPDCLDESDEVKIIGNRLDQCDSAEPTIKCEDIKCSSRIQSKIKMPVLCVPQRANLLLQAMFSIKPDSVSDLCWKFLMCLLHVSIFYEDQYCIRFCQNMVCSNIIQRSCPDMLLVPTAPVLFGHIYFAYSKYMPDDWLSLPAAPQYVCSSDQVFIEHFIVKPHIIFNNVTCFQPSDIGIIFETVTRGSINNYIKNAYVGLLGYNPIVTNDSIHCKRPNMYQCVNSTKCISKFRLNDNRIDCFYRDDEQMTVINGSCSMEPYKKPFICSINNRCISYDRIKDTVCDCEKYDFGLCEDERPDEYYAISHISFQTICDGFVELWPVNIDGRNETDETECEWWPCNNTYTRCDGIWNCFDGADEVDCDRSHLIHCPLQHHVCASPETNQLTCLPIQKANDGNIDCIGGTDESKKCRSSNYVFARFDFNCMNDIDNHCLPVESTCNGKKDCPHGDDEQFCNYTKYDWITYGICSRYNEWIHSDVESFICNWFSETNKQKIVHFSLDKLSKLTSNDTKHDRVALQSSSSMIRTFHQHHHRCHRGLDVQVWLNRKKNLTAMTCLCPPSFYGDMCQYQNQRVSLTMRFQVLSDAWRIPFVLLISLIDDSDDRVIHSHQQFTYLPMRDCQIKFSVYLFYSTRPKNHSKIYSIHIDIYEKISLVYRGSFLLPLTFPFLPVHRIATELKIPSSQVAPKICSNQQCLHGQCIEYINTLTTTTFCRCHQGWSGKLCTIPHNCTCSSDSLCAGFSYTNRSICVCPINRFGPRCLLTNPVCQSGLNGTCDNGGQCISQDEYIHSEKKHTCICPKGFTGERCEIPDTKIIISFHKDISLPQSMLVHFIQVVNNSPPERATTFKTILIQKDSVTVQWSRPFHIMFVELLHKSYYLIVAQNTYNQSAIINKIINPSDRCENISEFFNETIVNWHLLRRIKYYHLPCHQRQSSHNLSCFYDDVHLCLCENYGNQRLANCFEFEHNMKFDCSGQSGCENGARCFQDSPLCAQTSICACPACFYGKRCQFSTSGFGVSLDAILGYHILPH